jgi:hypothetical protein
MNDNKNPLNVVENTPYSEVKNYSPLTCCKLVFPFGAITAERLPLLLKEYTEHFHIANFVADTKIGKNRVTFAVVDLPKDVAITLNRVGIVSEVDLMGEAGNHYAKSEGSCCSKGKCKC